MGGGALAEATKHEIVHCALKRNANNKTLRQSRGRVSTWKGEKKRGSIRELGGNKGFAEPLFRVSDGLPFCVISGRGGLLFRGLLLRFDKS